MLAEITILKIKNDADAFFNRSSHDLEHTERVLAIATHIGKKEKADLEVITISALLHDIARVEEDQSKGSICHAIKGAEIAKDILSDYKIEGTKLNNIIHSIEAHRCKNDKVPSTLEAKILFDADKIDSLGAIGVGRTFHFAGMIGARVHNSKGVKIEDTKVYSEEDTAYREFILKYKNMKDTFFTTEGKRLAKERHEFMEVFFDRFLKEIEGKI